MTTSATIESAWETYVFKNAVVKAITPNAFPYEVTRESETELAALLHNQAINFFTYKTSRTEQWIGVNVLQESFLVEVAYYLEKDTSGEAWTAARNALETLAATVRTSLGDTWQGTVGYWEPQSEPPRLEETDIQGTPAWRGSFQFTAKI